MTGPGYSADLLRIDKSVRFVESDVESGVGLFTSARSTALVRSKSLPASRGTVGLALKSSSVLRGERKGLPLPVTMT